MKCQRCGKPAKTQMAHLGALCAGCFCTAIEKRIRKYVRINKVFSKGDRIIAVGELNQYLIPRIIKGLPAKIIFRKSGPKNTKSKEKVVVNWTIDDDATDFLEHVLTKKRRQRPVLSILRWTTDAELSLFAEFKKLEFKPNKKNPDIAKMIDTLELKHPETKFSIAKSIAQLDNLRK